LQTEITAEEIDDFERQAHQFLFHFSSLECGGGSRLDATLYVHWLAHHAAAGMRLHGPCAAYSCETLERHNSFERFFVRRHCNYRRDVAREVFLFDLMTTKMGCFERKKRAMKTPGGS
jgi:hypothetical protein